MCPVQIDPALSRSLISKLDRLRHTSCHANSLHPVSVPEAASAWVLGLITEDWKQEQPPQPFSAGFETRDSDYSATLSNVSSALP
jgi:hypothetical protein